MNSNNERLYEEILQGIGLSFDKRVIFDSAFTRDLPLGVFVTLQIAIDDFMPSAAKGVIEDFNTWSMALAKKQKDVGQETCIACCSLFPLLMQADSYRFTPDIVASACNSYELRFC